MKFKIKVFDQHIKTLYQKPIQLILLLCSLLIQTKNCKISFLDYAFGIIRNRDSFSILISLIVVAISLLHNIV